MRLTQIKAESGLGCYLPARHTDADFTKGTCMSIEILIKQPHEEFLERMVEEHDLRDHQDAIRALITFASRDDPQSNEDLFDYRCVGGCYDNDIPVSMATIAAISF